MKDDFKIYWRNDPIAKLTAGSDYLNPKIDLIIDEMIENNEKNNLNEYLSKWIIKKIEFELNSLIELKDIKEDNPDLRALAYRLYENNGVIKRSNISEYLKKIKQDNRKKLRKIGVKSVSYTHLTLPTNREV